MGLFCWWSSAVTVVCFFCSVFFCKKYCGLSFGKKKFFCGGRGSVLFHVFLIRRPVFVQNMPGGFHWWGCVLCFIQS